MKTTTVKMIRTLCTKKLHWLPVSVILVFTLTAAVSTGCNNSGYSGNKPGVAVSIIPQAGFLKNVGDAKINITAMVPANADPHTYEPKPSQIKELSQAKMYAKEGSGLEFELVWMDKLAAVNQNMLIVDCAKGIKLREMEEEHPGNEDEHHSGTDPHMWMSPLNAIIMVKNIAGGLIQIDPENKEYYENNRDSYVQKLTELDSDIREKLSKVQNRKFLVYHPSFGYFAAEYNLTMLTIEAEGKEPTAADLAHVIKEAQENNIKVVFASPQFNPQSAKVIADAIGGKVILIDPLAEDYIANMRFLLNEMVQVME